MDADAHFISHTQISVGCGNWSNKQMMTRIKWVGILLEARKKKNFFLHLDQLPILVFTSHLSPKLLHLVSTVMCLPIGPVDVQEYGVKAA